MAASTSGAAATLALNADPCFLRIVVRINPWPRGFVGAELSLIRSDADMVDNNVF
jgi:hypothetical protein